MLNEFIKENRKSFPKFFRAKELKKYYENNQLFTIEKEGQIIGFYVLEIEKFKSLFIGKKFRNMSREVLKEIFSKIKNENNLLTIAVNNKSKRVKNLCQKNGFEATQNFVTGKTHILEIYKWVK